MFRPWFEGGQPAEAAAAQHDTNSREWPVQLARDRRAGHAAAAQGFDLRLRLVIEPGRAVMWPRRAIGHAIGAFGIKAIAPFADSFAGNAERLGHRRHGPAALQAFDDQHSTELRGSGILMDVHPGLRVCGCWPRNHSLSPEPRRDNLHSSDS